MILQRKFKKEYAEALYDAVRNGHNLDMYAKETFDYDPEQVVKIPNLAYPEGLIDKLEPTPAADFRSAVALYEAYPMLTPLQAADKAFWTYMTHVDLFEYVQKRFPKVKEARFDNKNYVVDHWFMGKDWNKQHPLASLWWIVRHTVDEENEDKYKYTRFFFTNYAFRSNLIQYSIIRHKPAVFGYFDFLMDNPEIIANYFRPRNRFITKHLNKLGGVKLLSALPREAFYEEFCSIKDQVLAINSYNKKDKEEEQTEAEFFGSTV